MAFFLTTTLVLLYGANLYFSTNQNINDPLVPVIWPLAKDGVVLSLMAGYSFLAWRYVVESLRQPTIIFALLLAASASTIALLKYGVDRDTASMVKNAMLYQVGGAVIGFSFACRLGVKQMQRYLIAALYVAVFVGLLFLFHSVKSADGRAYGTYGNPTSFGYSSIVILGLALWRGTSIECVAAGITAATVYLFTGSVSVILAAFVVLATCGIADATLKRRLGRATVAGITFVAVISAACFATLLGSRSFIGTVRLVGFAVSPETILTTDSVSVRAADLQSVADSTNWIFGTSLNAYHRFDSYLLSLWVNFGILPILAYAALMISVLVAFTRHRSKMENLPIFILLVALFVVNPLLQHQLEVFPTNLLFFLILGFSIKAFSAPSKFQH